MNWSAALLLLVGCGSSSPDSPDAAVAPPDAWPTAPHTPYPQLPDHGGPKLPHPQVVTVTFAGDPRAADLEAYAQWLVGSQWITLVGGEYGVGTGGIAGVAHRPETPLAMLTNADIEAYLAAGITDGSLPKAASLSDTLYVVYYPRATSIRTTFVNGIMKSSCTDFGGFHSEAHQGALSFSYVVIPDCAGTPAGLTELETSEMIVSHEVIEASTDAFPISTPAWQLTPDDNDVWFTAFEFEVENADLCENPSRWAREDGHVVQRSWSNRAALTGEPCLPVDPALPAFGVTARPAGVQHVAPGSTTDFTLTGWATGKIDDWKLSGRVSGPLGTRITFSTTSVNNAGTVTAHVTVPASAAGKTVPIYVYSQHLPEDATMWPIVVDVSN